MKVELPSNDVNCSTVHCPVDTFYTFSYSVYDQLCCPTRRKLLLWSDLGLGCDNRVI